MYDPASMDWLTGTANAMDGLPEPHQKTEQPGASFADF